MNLYLVADYGSGDLAWAEVESALRRSLPELGYISRVELPSFDTWACALALLQLEQNISKGDIVFHNVAPRKDDISGRRDNAGEPLAAGWSERGALFFGPNSGQSWSLLYPKLSLLQRVACPSDGSQFRSRDIFPGTLPLLLARSPGILQEPLVPPVMPIDRVLATDGYGNLKTTLTPGVPEGGEVKIRINGKDLWATVSEGSFAVSEGETALSPGSSAGLWEIFTRGGSAAAAFAYPKGGSPIEIST